MIREFLSALSALSATLVMAFADESPARPAEAGVARFTAAYQAWDASGFAGAAGCFRAACSENPRSAVNFYWLGTAEFHRMLHCRNRPRPDTEEADAAMDKAIAALETAVTIDPHHAESHALLGTLYGMKIQGSLIRAIRYGPSVQEHRKQALRSGAANPRVRYLSGTGLFHTAKDAGGYREALDELLAAEKRFIAEAGVPPAPLAPRWGFASCRTFIGRTLLKLGDKARAAEYFRKALAQHPNDHIARAELEKLTRP